ncbi:hypothetical protein ACT691_01555 [Vibrio metschnikovii]
MKNWSKASVMSIAQTQKSLIEKCFSGAQGWRCFGVIQPAR